MCRNLIASKNAQQLSCFNMLRCTKLLFMKRSGQVGGRLMMTRPEPFTWVRIGGPRLLLIGLLMIACADDVRAETQPPAPNSVATPGASDRSRIHPPSVSKIEMLEQLILGQNDAIEDLKAKLARQQSVIDKLIDRLQMKRGPRRTLVLLLPLK